MVFFNNEFDFLTKFYPNYNEPLKGNNNINNIIFNKNIPPFNPSTNINNMNNTNNMNNYNQLAKELNLKILNLEKENKELRNIKINKENEIFKSKQELMKKEQEIKDLKSKLKDVNYVKNLEEELGNKKKEIIELNKKLLNYENMNQYDNLYNLITINFKSGDDKIDYKIKCLTTDIFATVEEKLYQKYEEYRNTDNTFLLNGTKILRFKTIRENKIKDGDIIQLQNISNIIGFL